MSDSVNCERCGVTGRRRRGRVAPEGWLYAEFKDDTSGSILFVYACSKECTAVEWKEGPGVLGPIDLDAKYLDVLTQHEEGWHEHSIQVREGDRILLGSSEVRVGVGYELVPESATS